MRESNEISIPGLADHEADDADETTDGFIENTHAEADSGSIGFSYTGDNVVAAVSVSAYWIVAMVFHRVVMDTKRKARKRKKRKKKRNS